MPDMLPADPPRSRSLTDVWPNVIGALDRQGGSWFPPARSAIVFVVDGLGALNLGARSGHSRFLASRATKRDVARTVFPSTTAAALASLMTATAPGEHGIVGYRALVPGRGVVANQLTGWESEGMDPSTWQRSPTVFERAAAQGRPCFVVSKETHVGSGYTRAVFRGAEFVSARGMDERAEIAEELAVRHPGALVYLYTPDLDRIGHRSGWESDEWATALEAVDAAARRLDATRGAGIGVVVTADHGMVDVPPHRQVLLVDGDDVLRGVREIGGEPRMLHVYLEADADADAVLAAWRARESARSWVMSRAEAIEAKLFGAVDPEVASRIGDIVIAARSKIAYYDDRLVDKSAQKMVGQHGSLTPEERIVPLVPLGAFAG